MSAHHTPGPWEIDEENIHECMIHANGIPIASVFDNPDSGMEPLGEEPSEANARLIAAAPDLLEALKKALPHIPSNAIDIDATERSLVSNCWISEIAQAAIAKAEGLK